MKRSLPGPPVFAVLIAVLVSSCASVQYNPSIIPGDFVGAVDNRFMPLKPGTKLVYEGPTEEGMERNEVTVTRDTKVVMGVKCLVIHDVVWTNGELTEETYDWYAQDKQGNVWYFGEDSREMKTGKVVSTKGSWEAGVNGALPGIVMPADPQVGKTYRQEYLKGEAEDMAEVASLQEQVRVPYGSFTGCLKTMEWTPLEPGVLEYKYYAPGVGVVLETTRGSKERSELVQVVAE